MTYQDFEKGLAMMSFCGFQGKDPQQVAVWFKLISHLDAKDFELAVMDLCRTHKAWWDNQNVPCLILDQVIANRKKPKLDRFHIAPTGDHSQKMIEEGKPDPDVMKKVSDLARGIGHGRK